MRWLVVFLVSCGSLCAHIAALKEPRQTFINDGLLGQGTIFEIMQDSISAIECVEGHKIYLDPERIVPSHEGLMLVADNASLILLPRLYSDRYGCYVKSFIMCTSCGFEIPGGISLCPQCME